MNKKGFTLVELLVVIVIIGVLSVIIVPSIININKNINERLYEEKKENIVSAAILYANNHEEIFNGVSEAVVYVKDLVDSKYFTADATKAKCDEYHSVINGVAVDNNNGCVLDPRTTSGIDTKNMNQYKVILTKEGATVVGKYVGASETGDGNGESTLTSKTLVAAVCKKFDSKPGKAYYNNQVTDCKCVSDSNGNYTSISVNTGNGYSNNSSVKACLFSGTSVDNYLKYGDSKANWRVLGVYLDASPEYANTLVAKMITSDPI